MGKVTIKALKDEIQVLNNIDKFQKKELDKLNKELDNIKNNKNVVTKEEYDILVKNIEKEKLKTSEYKRLYYNIKKEYNMQRNKYIDEIKKLEKQLIESSEIKLNEKNSRNAGRKAYSNKEVIEMIYNYYLENKSLQHIADELNRLEIKTNRNKSWSKSSIRFILLNSKNVTNKFISQDLYNCAVELLKNKNRHL